MVAATMVAARAASVCSHSRLGARFNAPGRAGRGKSPGAPSKLNADHRRALAEVVEAGPVPAVTASLAAQGRRGGGDVRHRSTRPRSGRELKALGFAKISARPRHYENELASRLLKKLPRRRRRSARPRGVEIELWWLKLGQKNKLTSPMGQTWHAPAGAPLPAHRMGLFGAICPAKGKAPGWSSLVRHRAMATHLIEISAAVDPGAHAVLIVDQPVGT